MQAINDLKLNSLAIQSMAYLVPGDVYQIAVSDLTLLPAGVKRYAFTTVNSFLYHQLYVQTTSEDLSINTYEGGVATGGTPVSALNLNRNSAKVFPSVISEDVTITTPGVLVLHTRMLGSPDQGSKSSSTEGSRAVPMLLKHDTLYYLEVINNGVAESTIVMEFQVVALQADG